MDKLKIGLIASGELGRYYGQMIHNQIKNAILIATSSKDEKDADFFRYKLGINQIYNNHQLLLELNELDAIVICAEPENHAQLIIDSAEAYFHTFCEKPIALNVSDAERVLACASKKASQSTIIGFERRFDDSYIRAKRNIEEGKIGTPYLMRSHTLASLQYSGLKNNANSKGIFFDLALSDIDATRWLLQSEFEQVMSLGHSDGAIENDLQDLQSVISSCNLSANKMAQFTACKIRPKGYHTGSEIFGTEGSIQIKNDKSHVITFNAAGIGTQGYTSHLDRFSIAYERQLQKFVNDILNTQKFTLNLQESVNTTKAAVALTKSYVLGKMVDLQD